MGSLDGLVQEQLVQFQGDKYLDDIVNPTKGFPFLYSTTQARPARVLNPFLSHRYQVGTV